MATLTVGAISRSGLTRSLASAAVGGDEFANDGKTFLEVANGSGSSITVTIATQMTVDGKAVADDAISVGAGVTKQIGPFPPHIYNDANGKVQVTYSAVTTVTVGATRLP